MSLKFIEAEFGSELQKRSIELRDKILRKPLGMIFTEEYLAAEHDCIHLVVMRDDELLACLVLRKQGEKMQMRQVAVDNNLQKQGIGSQMIAASEAIALKHSCQLMHCQARETAVPFYERLGYYTVGERSEIIGLPHFYMEKPLK